MIRTFMEASMIHTFIAFHVEPGRGLDFERAHRGLAQIMGAQPGCIEIKVHRSLTDPLEYMVYGTWQSKEVWDRAHQKAGFGELFRGLPIVDHTLSKAVFFEPVYSIQPKDRVPAEQPGT